MFDNIANVWQHGKCLTTLRMFDNIANVWQHGKYLTTLQMFDNMANVWQHSCFLQFLSLVFWLYLLEVWKYLWHHYLDDFMLNCLMYFEDSIPGSGRVPLIAELSESTKSSSHSIIVSSTFQTPNKSCPLQATIRTIQNVC